MVVGTYTTPSHHRKLTNATTASSISSSSSQPIIVLYISTDNDDTIIAAGYDNSPQPIHVSYIPLHSKAHESLRSMRDAEDIFHYYASTIERLVHLCGGGGIISTTTSGIGNSKQSQNQNRYVILHNFGLYINRYWKIAIVRILQDVCNATMVSFLSTIHMIPFSIVSPPTVLSSSLSSNQVPDTSSNSSAKINVVLSIHISTNKAQCMVYANGHHLDYTYQSCDYEDIVHDDQQNNAATVMVDDIRKKQETWLVSCETSSIIRAIVSCILKCPTAIRLHAIQNLYFSGTILVQNFQERVAYLLYQFLSNNNDKSSDSDNKSILSIDELTLQPSSNNTQHGHSVQYTHVPINRTPLYPLAQHIAILHHPCCSFSGSINDSSNDTITISTELLPWLGTSIYVSYWKYYEHECGIVPIKEMNWMYVTINNAWKIFKE